MVRVAFLTAFLVAVAAAVSSPALAIPNSGEAWLPSMAEVQHVESKVTMPDGAQAMSAYVRYYAGITVEGRKVIYGVYLATGVVRDMKQDPRAGIRIVTAREVPEIEDGGCSQVTVEFDVTSDSVTRIRCNGLA